MKKIIAMMVVALAAGVASADMLVNLPSNTTWVAATTNFNNKTVAAQPSGIAFTTSDMRGGINVAANTPGATTNSIFGGYKISGANNTGVTTWGVVEGGGGTTADYIGSSGNGSGAIGDKAASLFMFGLTAASTVTNINITANLAGTMANFLQDGSVNALGFRIALQKGSSYYLSDLITYSSGARTTNMTATALAGHTWYNFDPTADMLSYGTSVSGMTFDNITAVGEYAFAQNSVANPVGGASLKDFIVQGVAIPEPATVGMLGLGALVTLLFRRMRG